MTQQPQGWHREDIKAALVKRYGPIVHLSETWGYDRAAITNALRAPQYSKTLEKRIAQALGVTAHELWPDRWSEDDAPLPWSTLGKPTTRGRGVSCQKSRAA